VTQPRRPADTLRITHAVLTVVWAALAVPTVLWWHDSVLWVGLISVYANVVGHASAWQASRAEKAAQDS
jgi:hypothetical protein